jgi:trigger factor
MRKLVENHKFEVPETLIQHQMGNRLREMIDDMIGRGFDPRSQELDWEGAREKLRPLAEDDVRSSMLLDLISKEEKIDVSEEEIEAEIRSIAVATRQPLEQVQATLTKEGGKRSIANRLRNRKALDLLVENADITEEEWSDEAVSKVASQDAGVEQQSTEDDAKTSLSTS